MLGRRLVPPPGLMYGQRRFDRSCLWGLDQDARQESTVLELQHLFNECKGVWGKKSARRSGLTVVDHLNDSSDASLGENSW